MLQRVSDTRVYIIAKYGRAARYQETEALALDLRDARAEIVRLNGQTHYDASAEEAARLRGTLASLDCDMQNAVNDAFMARVDVARWRECAGELAAALRRAEHAGGEFGNECPACSFDREWPERHDPEGCWLADALARFDAMKMRPVLAGLGVELQRKYDAAVSHVPVADANAAITKLQRELDRKERDSR